MDLYDEVFSRVCDRKKAKHLVAVEKKFNKMFENSDVKSIGTKDLRQMIELKHTKCKARPLRKDFDQGVRILMCMNQILMSKERLLIFLMKCQFGGGRGTK